MERKLLQVWVHSALHAELSKIAKTRRINISELVRQMVREEIARDKRRDLEGDPLASIDGNVRVLNDRTEYLVLAVNGLLKYHQSPEAYTAVKDHYSVLQERKNG